MLTQPHRCISLNLLAVWAKIPLRISLSASISLTQRPQEGAVAVKVEFRGQVFEFDKRMKVKELLEKLNLSPESTIVVRGDEVLTEDEWVEEDDEVKVISAISGGV
jgi:sulfur carrier protein